MSSLRRAGWGLLVLLVALTACKRLKEEGPEGAKAVRETASPSKIETEAVAFDLPAGAALVVSVHDLQGWWSRLESTKLYADLMAIPDVQRALDPKQNPRVARAFSQFEQRFGMPLNKRTLFDVLGEKLQIGLYPATGDSAATQRMVVVADMGDKDAVGALLSGVRTDLEGKGGKFASETYKGVDVTVASDAQGAVRALYGFHKEKLVASSDQAGLQSAVDALDGEGATMARDTLYQRALTHLGEANVTLFVNKGGYKGLMGAMERAQAAAGRKAAGPGADRVLDVVDRYNIQNALVAGSHWTDEGLEVRSYSMLDPAAPGAAPLRDMLKTPPSEIEVVGYFPDSTLAFYAVNFLDAVKIYDFALAYMKDVAGAADTSAAAGGAAARVDQRIAQFQQTTGMDIRTDILGWMGKEAAFGLNGVVKGGFFPVPELSLVVQSTDPARAKAFFDKLEGQVTALVRDAPQTQGMPLQFQEENYKGVKVRYAPTPMGEGLAPAYALQDDYALIALSRATLKRMLDAKAGGMAGVTGNARFESLSEFFPGEANLVGFANTAQLLNEVASMVTTFQQMGGRQTSQQTEDTVTRLIGALQNIEAAGTYGLNDGGGVEQRFLVRIR